MGTDMGTGKWVVAYEFLRASTVSWKLTMPLLRLILHGKPVANTRAWKHYRSAVRIAELNKKAKGGTQ